MTVEGGELVWQTGSASLRLTPGETRLLYVAPGDRLRATAPDRATTLRIAGLGRLEMSLNCELEIEDMEWNRFGPGAAIGGAVVAVIAGAVHYTSGDGTEVARTGDTLTMRPGEVESLQSALDRAAQLEEELQSAQGRITELELANSRVSVRTETPADARQIEEPEEEPDPSWLGARYSYGELRSVLDEIDWATSGEATASMVPLLQEMLEAMQSGEELSMEMAGEIQALNGVVLKEMSALAKGEIPGTGVNGAFSHPVVAANLMDATH